MQHVLIFSQKNDAHAKKVAEKINGLGHEASILEREEFGESWTISALSSKIGFDVIVELPKSSIVVDNATAIYNRRDFTVESQEVQGDLDDATRQYVAAQKAIHVNSLLTALQQRTRMMNKLDVNRTTSSKLNQLFVAQQLGLSIPNTFMGGSAKSANRFQKETSSDLIIKPLEALHLKSSNGTFAHYTTKFERRTEDDLHSLTQCPVILQNLVPKKEELRVTVVGTQLFTCKIETSTASAEARLDWRHFDWANTPHYKTKIAGEVAEKLLAFMAYFGAIYGAFDLIVTPDGEAVFLEMNSMGQWLWIEDLTELPISEAIAHWLTKND